MTIREWIADDWPVVWAMASDERVTTYQTWLRLESEEAAREWVASAIHHNELRPQTVFNMAIVLKDHDDPMGWLGWGIDEPVRFADVSFGYALLPAAWGNGYMTEAIQGMLKFVFEDLGKQSVMATCAASNVGSSRALEKSGLEQLHRWSERDKVTDIEEEHLMYRLEQKDWAGPVNNH